MTDSENVALVRAIIESFRAGDLDMEFEQEGYFDAGDQVVVFQRLRARGRASGAEAGFGDYAQLWTIRDGKVVRMKFYADRDDALHAAGLGG